MTSGPGYFRVFGPSQVDFACGLDQRQTEHAFELGMSPGGWLPLETLEAVSEIAAVLGCESTRGSSIATRLLDFADSGRAHVVAGSSTLGMLSAMPSQMIRGSTYATTVAVDGAGIVPLSARFMAEASASRIRLEPEKVHGQPPVGFVLTAIESSDRMLASYPGVAQDAPASLAFSERPLVFDLYELRRPEVANWIESQVQSVPGYMGLGSPEAFDDDVRIRACSLIEAGSICSIAGTAACYAALLPEFESYRVAAEEFAKHPLLSMVPRLLVTFGDQGMSCCWDGVAYHQAADLLKAKEIVNTSGAGDTAAGVFFAGVLANDDPREILARAASHASLVLRQYGSRLG